MPHDDPKVKVSSERLPQQINQLECHHLKLQMMETIDGMLASHLINLN